MENISKRTTNLHPSILQPDNSFTDTSFSLYPNIFTNLIHKCETYKIQNCNITQNKDAIEITATDLTNEQYGNLNSTVDTGLDTISKKYICIDNKASCSFYGFIKNENV
jgi:hypothetical protein